MNVSVAKQFFPLISSETARGTSNLDMSKTFAVSIKASSKQPKNQKNDNDNKYQDCKTSAFQVQGEKLLVLTPKYNDNTTRTTRASC